MEQDHFNLSVLTVENSKLRNANRDLNLPQYSVGFSWAISAVGAVAAVQEADCALAGS